STSAKAMNPLSKPGALGDQGEGDDAGRERRQEHLGPGKGLIPGLGAGGQQTPVLGRQDLDSQGGRGGPGLGLPLGAGGQLWGLERLGLSTRLSPPRGLLSAGGQGVA